MTLELAAAQGAASPDSTDTRPYSPSWVDAITGVIDRAPGPTWLAYLLLLLLACLTASTEGWIAGVSSFPAIDPWQASYGVYFIAPLAVIHYLDGVAGEAWDQFRPATNLVADAAARVRYELTVTPARPALALLVFGYLANTAWFAADPAGTQIAGQPVLYVLLRVFFEGFISAVLFVLVFHTIRQLRIVSSLHRSAVAIDLYHPTALHAMSRLTARSAFLFIALAVMIDLPYPGTSEQIWIETVVLFGLPLLGLAAVVFFLPLRGLHDRLAEEKQKLLGAAASSLETSIAALHRLVIDEAANATDVEASRVAQTRIDALSKAQSALIQEQDLVGRLSTWPWNANTLRAVVSAVALPIALFLLTRMLERFV